VSGRVYFELSLASRLTDERIAIDDPAESFHEASKFVPSMLARQGAGVTRYFADELLQSASARSVRRLPSAQSIALPPPELPPLDLSQAIAARRTSREFGDRSLSLPALAGILHAAYGVTATRGRFAYRSVPSGGALFPLELYLGVARVDDLEPGVYHFDPLRRVLEPLAGTSPDTLGEILLVDVSGRPALTLLIAATFNRNRFKYGLRGYRFALYEAGHVAQNALLACVALGLAALPVGGFFDQQLDDLLGLDGVNESTLYPICIGPPRESEWSPA
jgi:SagB-type dehydrogenase family enzyme